MAYFLFVQEETFINRVEVKVKIPEELKPWLVDDWDLITRQKQVSDWRVDVTVDYSQYLSLYTVSLTWEMQHERSRQNVGSKNTNVGNYAMTKVCAEAENMASFIEFYRVSLLVVGHVVM